MTNIKPKVLTVWVAGSTQRTVRCAQALLDDHQFIIRAVITPQAKIVGRTSEAQPNPLHQLALAQQLPLILIDQKIDASVQSQVDKLIQQDELPDCLLVVDFGYIIPDWLLHIPKIAPINVHPSLLPRWRGSSPGQFILLAGEEESGVSFMRVESGLDTGAIYHQARFSVNSSWTSAEYYQASFDLAASLLPQVLLDMAGGLKPVEQPPVSPTPEARQLQRSDGFLAWTAISRLQTGQIPVTSDIPKLWLSVATVSQPDDLTLLARAIKALSPWPGVWTLIPTTKGEKRMKIITIQSNSDQLVLDQVQVEGQQPASWNQVKNILSEN